MNARKRAGGQSKNRQNPQKSELLNSKKFFCCIVCIVHDLFAIRLPAVRGRFTAGSQRNRV